MTLDSIIDDLRRSVEEKRMVLHYRITWIDGKPYLQCVRAGESYDLDGMIVRAATPADLENMYAGRLSFDSETEPSRKAWEKHVAEGGD